MNIGNKIRELLIEKNMTQTQLSIDAKIPLPKLNLIITGKRRIQIDELEIICWALDTEVSTFLAPRPPMKKGA